MSLFVYIPAGRIARACQARATLIVKSRRGLSLVVPWRSPRSGAQPLRVFAVVAPLGRKAILSPATNEPCQSILPVRSAGNHTVQQIAQTSVPRWTDPTGS